MIATTDAYTSMTRERRQRISAPLLCNQYINCSMSFLRFCKKCKKKRKRQFLLSRIANGAEGRRLYTKILSILIVRIERIFFLSPVNCTVKNRLSKLYLTSIVFLGQAIVRMGETRHEWDGEKKTVLQHFLPHGRSHMCGLESLCSH